MVGRVEETRNTFAIEEFSLTPLRRLLGNEDGDYLARALPGFAPRLIAHRRSLANRYIDTIAADLRKLWAARRASARVENQRDFKASLKWRAETARLVWQLRAAVLLHGLGIARPHLADRAIRKTQDFVRTIRIRSLPRIE